MNRVKRRNGELHDEASHNNSPAFYSSGRWSSYQGCRLQRGHSSRRRELQLFSLVFDIIQKAILKDPDLRQDGRLFSFEDTLSRVDVGIYYLSFVVALAMTVPVFYLSPVGQGRSFGKVIRDLPYVEGTADNEQ